METCFVFGVLQVLPGAPASNRSFAYIFQVLPRRRADDSSDLAG